MSSERETSLELPCQMCNEPVTIWFDIADWNDWQGGTLIQDAMPYLDLDEREMLISRTCGKCWEKLFPED